MDIFSLLMSGYFFILYYCTHETTSEYVPSCRGRGKNEHMGIGVLRHETIYEISIPHPTHSVTTHDAKTSPKSV